MYYALEYSGSNWNLEVLVFDYFSFSYVLLSHPWKSWPLSFLSDLILLKGKMKPSSYGLVEKFA